METRASYVLIGAFTLGIMVLAFFFVLWIGKLQLDREWDYYDIVFREAVTGLTVGGAVQYSGIQLGEVRRLTLSTEHPGEVIARVRLKGGTPVKTDTRAKLTFTGITGVAVIQLSGGSTQSQLLNAAAGQNIPRIVADESALQRLLASGEDMMTSINDLLLRLSMLLREENLNKVAATLDHVEKITSITAMHSADIGRAMTDLAQASRGLRATMARTESLVEKLQTLADNGNQILDTEAREMLASARQSLESARRFTDSAQAVVAENRDAIASFSNQGLAQVGPAIADLRSALRNLQRLTEQLDENPSVLISGPDKSKEYDAR